MSESSMSAMNRLRSRRSLRLVVLPFWVAAGTWLVPPSVRVQAVASTLSEGRLAEWFGVDAGQEEEHLRRDGGNVGRDLAAGNEVRSPVRDSLIEYLTDALWTHGQAVRSVSRDVTEDRAGGGSVISGRLLASIPAPARGEALRAHAAAWVAPVERELVCDNPQGP